jgi:hypothetical protein
MSVFTLKSRMVLGLATLLAATAGIRAGAQEAARGRPLAI